MAKVEVFSILIAVRTPSIGPSAVIGAVVGSVAAVTVVSVAGK